MHSLGGTKKKGPGVPEPLAPCVWMVGQELEMPHEHQPLHPQTSMCCCWRTSSCCC